MVFLILLEVLVYFYAAYVILHNIYGVLPKRSIFKYVLPLVYLLLGFFDIMLKDSDNQILLLVLLLLNIVILKYIFTDARFKTIVLIYIVLYSINISLSSIVLLLFDKYDQLFQKTIGIIISILIVLIVLFICYKKNSFIKSRFQFIPSNVKLLSVFSLISSAIILFFISGFSFVVDIDKWSSYVRIVIMFLILIINSGFPVLISNSIGKSFYAEQYKNFEQQMEIQAKHYKMISKSNYELRKFRHDYKNMRIGITKHIKDGNLQSAEEMLIECDSVFNQSLNLIKFDTGNDIVDAILTEKQEQAMSFNSSIIFEGCISSDGISSVDLCIIFGNLLDNAIESCQKIYSEKENIICVECKCTKGFMFLKITNPVDKDIKIHNNSITTSKENKNNHGFGLSSVQKAIEKYHGRLTLNCENHIFTTEIVMDI